MKKAYKYIREPEYKRIRALLDTGFAVIEVEKILRGIDSWRSHAAVLEISKSKDFADYKRLQQERLEKYVQAKKTKAEVELQPKREDDRSLAELVLLRQELIQVKKILVAMDTSLTLIRSGSRIKLG